MYYNNGGVTNLREKSILPANDDEGGVGGLNCTPCLVKPLVIMSLSFESHVTFVMNLKP
jgi:hypothetical protein